jgi:o-succinylbenzoate synthase
MTQAHFYKYTLRFKIPAGTSRGVMQVKNTYFLIVKQENKIGIGECALFKGLSSDDIPEYEQVLQQFCKDIETDQDYLTKKYKAFPSIVFGYEQAIRSLESQDLFALFDNDFLNGKHSIPINGLIWMGDKNFMKEQIIQKIENGFDTIKLKIGALDFQTELDILKFIRSEFSTSDLSLRVDANGAFLPEEGLEKLKRLTHFDIHSIEQPIKQGQWEVMASLCEKTPIPIALDEELIGIYKADEKAKLLQVISPQYIILKPALHGGFSGSDEWIDLAEKQNIGWWITSALESNIGLNAIAQYTAHKKVTLPQGLGTGGLFTNNFESPLYVEKGKLHYNTDKTWNTQKILDQIINKV